MSTKINVGDWVVAGRGDDADYGFVVSKRSDGLYSVSWFGSMTQTLFADGGDKCAFATKDEAHAEFVSRMNEVNQ